MKRKVSNAVVRRLPKYYRFLDELHRRNVTRTSSHELADELGFTASQVRQDFNCFGGFGQQGYGYGVDRLRGEIASILGLDELKNAVLVGAGNLGRALLGNFDFTACGFKLLAGFDTDPSIIGKNIGNTPIFSMDELPKFAVENDTKLAALTVPTSALEDTLRCLEKLNFEGAWNFTGRDLSTEDTSLIIENVHFTESLMALRYHLKAASCEQNG